MLYLVRPEGGLEWILLPALVLHAAAQHGTDLAPMDWQLSGRYADATIVSLALRYGVKCSTGLVLEAGYVATTRSATSVVGRVSIIRPVSGRTRLALRGATLRGRVVHRAGGGSGGAAGVVDPSG